MFTELKLVAIINKRVGMIAEAIDEGEKFTEDDIKNIKNCLLINVDRLLNVFKDKCLEK